MGKGDETRTAILIESARLASTIGLNALSVGALADRTGLSKSGLFAHFKSKEQLQLQTLEYAGEFFVDVVLRPALTASRGEKRVRVLFERWLEWETRALPGGCIFAAAGVEFDDQPGPVRDALVRQQRDWGETIAAVAATAVAEGDFRADVDPGQFSFELQGIMTAFQRSTRLLGDPLARDRTMTAFDRLLDSAH